MADVFGLTAHKQLTCGCHVHVGISSDEEGVAVATGEQAGGLQPLLLGGRLPFPLRVPYALVIRPQAATVTI
jgi:carboxylate-amine ligase